jgi:hypothetical protein
MYVQAVIHGHQRGTCPTHTVDGPVAAEANANTAAVGLPQNLLLSSACCLTLLLSLDAGQVLQHVSRAADLVRLASCGTHAVQGETGHVST